MRITQLLDVLQLCISNFELRTTRRVNFDESDEAPTCRRTPPPNAFNAVEKLKQLNEERINPDMVRHAFHAFSTRS